MDPTAAYLEMFNAMNAKDHATAREHAFALQEWFKRGGFYPTTYSRVEVNSYLANVLRRTAYLACDGALDHGDDTGHPA